MKRVINKSTATFFCARVMPENLSEIIDHLRMEGYSFNVAYEIGQSRKADISIVINSPIQEVGVIGDWVVVTRLSDNPFYTDEQFRDRFAFVEK